MCAPENLYIPIATNLLNYPARNVFAPEKLRRESSDETTPTRRSALFTPPFADMAPS